MLKIIQSCFWLFLLALVTSTVNAQSVDTLKVQSSIFNQERTISIFLPPGYNDFPNTEKSYKVVYLLDSQSEPFFNFYKETIKYLTKLQYLQPVILVGISSGNRQFEFTPPASTEDGKKAFRKGGGADTLALHLQNELLPIIKKKYRTNGYNVGVGHSLGGTFVTYSLISYPNLFNAVIAISPNLYYDEENIIKQFRNVENPRILNHKFLYIDYGSGDRMEDLFKPATEKLKTILSQKDIAGLRWHINHLDNHSHGTTAMEGIFKGLIDLNTQLTLNDVKLQGIYKDDKKPFIDNIKAYFQELSQWSQIQVPTSDDLNYVGYNCFYTGRKKDAIEVFKWALSIYPKDINLHDGMGEMQQDLGNKAEANKYYSKALKMTHQLKGSISNRNYSEMVAFFQKRLNSLQGDGK